MKRSAGKHWIAAAAMAGLLAASCAEKPEPKPGAKIEPATSVPPPPPAVDARPTGPVESVVPPAPAAVKRDKEKPPPLPADLHQVDFAGFEKEVASHKGKVVAVDCWATWCVPCKAKFPKFVELSRKYPREQAAFLTLSFDESDARPAAAEFLAEQAPAAKNLICSDELQSVQERIGFEGIPQYLLYGKDGKLLLKSDKIESLDAALAEQLK